MVLTQPNSKHWWVANQYHKFPYHYGSYATGVLMAGFLIMVTFPYHYGSYATNLDVSYGAIASFRFHTTMVLTQLPHREVREDNHGNVSIPLWFLRNV